MFTIITKDSLPDFEVENFKGLSNAVKTNFKNILTDSAQYLFKLHMESLEGAPKYTEWEFTRLAADTSAYQPLKSFAELFPGSGYSRLWLSRYATNTTINPVRFVGREGFSNRNMFYFSGLAK